MLELRNWLIDLRDDPDGYFDEDGAYHGVYRASERRNGEPGKGPLKLSVREDVLTRLKEVQAGLGEEIVSPAEEKLIREVWHNDSIDS